MCGMTKKKETAMIVLFALDFFGGRIGAMGLEGRNDPPLLHDLLRTRIIVRAQQFFVVSR